MRTRSPSVSVAADHTLRGKHHEQRDRDRDDEALPDVENAERGLRFHRCAFVLPQVLVVALRLVLFVVEVLDRFVIEQTVDRPGVRARVQLVRLPPDVRAPFGDPDGERDVDHDRTESHRHEAPVEARKKHDCHQRELEHDRDDREQHVGEQRRDAARAALDVARDAAGLAFEMKAQRERVQMAKDVERDAPHRPLRDAHEHEVAQLGEKRGGKPQQPVGGEQRERQREHRLGGRERVDDFLQHERHADVGELRGHQEHERDHDAPLVFPHVRQEHRDDPPFREPLRDAGCPR